MSHRYPYGTDTILIPATFPVAQRRRRFVMARLARPFAPPPDSRPDTENLAYQEVACLAAAARDARRDVVTVADNKPPESHGPPKPIDDGDIPHPSLAPPDRPGLVPPKTPRTA